MKKMELPSSFKLFPLASTMFSSFLKGQIGMPIFRIIISKMTGHEQPVSQTKGWTVEFFIFTLPLILLSIIGEVPSFLASLTLPISSASSSMVLCSMFSWMFLVPQVGEGVEVRLPASPPGVSVESSGPVYSGIIQHR